MVTRAEVVQGLLSLYDQPAYLEVGVGDGDTFHAVKARRKVAVDPKFNFDPKAAAKAAPEASFHQVPSDEYFGQIAPADERFEVIYLDGLHTFDQTLRDLINALRLIQRNGVIIIDDLKPANYAASLKDRDQFWAVKEAWKIPKGSWMGDVYRLVFFIHSYCQQFTYRAVADNHGQLVMWHAPRRAGELGGRSVEQVARAPFEDTVLDAAAFNFKPFAEILADAGAAVRGSR